MGEDVGGLLTSCPSVRSPVEVYIFPTLHTELNQTHTPHPPHTLTLFTHTFTLVVNLSSSSTDMQVLGILKQEPGEPRGEDQTSAPGVVCHHAALSC